MSPITEIPLACIVDHPDQPRYGEGDIDALAASILEVGQLEPIIVLSTDTPEAAHQEVVVLAGHRRTAALRKLGRQTVNAIVLEGVDREDAVKAIMASNTAREALTPLEEARGYQTMLDLGITPKAVAKVTGRKAEHVERTAKLAGAFSDDNREDVMARAVSLDEYEVLARHEGNPERFGELMAAVGTREFEWMARNADRAAAADEMRAWATAKLQKAGVQILKTRGSWELPAKAAMLRNLRDDGDDVPLSAKAHADCPGHAAIVEAGAASKRDAITYVCTDWAAHGHTHSYRKAGGEAKNPEAEAQAKDRAWKKRIKPTTEPRRQWVRALLAAPPHRAPGGAMTIQGAGPFLLQTALHGNFQGALEVACELLGVKVEAETDVTTSPAWATVAREQIAAQDWARAMLALACAIGDEAVRLSKDPGSRYYWDQDKAARYLRFLNGSGYQLTDVERELVDAAAIHEAKEGSCPASDPDCECDGGDCNDACADPEACDPTTHHPEDIADGTVGVDTLTGSELIGEYRVLLDELAFGTSSGEETLRHVPRFDLLCTELRRRGIPALDRALDEAGETT